MNNISRRRFLKSSWLGLAGMSGIPSMHAQWGKFQDKVQRKKYLIKNAYVITMDPSINDVPDGDVIIEDGIITDIGRNLSRNDAVILEGKSMILLPGLIDTHWHMWTALLRSMAGNNPGEGYFDVTRQLGRYFLPEDMYNATMLAATEATFSGITTVHDWSHNVRSLQHAENSLKALKESGLRARYSCGAAAGQDAGQPVDFSILQYLKNNWKKYSSDDLISLGFAWRGLGGQSDNNSVRKVREEEFNQANKMNLPISVHASTKGVIGEIIDAGLMKKGLQIVHGMQATEEELKAMERAEASISISPYSELRVGYGIPPIKKALESGTITGLSVDTTTLSGNADMFAIMKVYLNLANALYQDEFAFSARKVLELATIGGAKSLGISGVTGSLTPGKRADLIMVSTKAPNIGVFTNPVDLIVEAAQPWNVDTVMVDGRILKKNGKLIAINEEEVYANSRKALNSLIARANN